MPIFLAPTNTEIMITRIATDPKETSRLAALGITVEAKVTVLSSSGGAVVVLVKGSRLALDREPESRIFVA